MRGSLLLTFDETIRGLGGGNCKIYVNNVLKYQQFTKVDELFTTYIDTGDTVRMVFDFQSSTINTLSIVRREYTTDDEEGNSGIYETFITGATGNTFDVSFVVAVSNKAYEFMYTVVGKPKEYVKMNIGSGFTGTTDQRLIGIVVDTEIDSQNRLVCSGRYTNYNGTNVPPIVRLLPDGTLDTSFNYTGPAMRTVTDIIVDNNDKIILSSSDGDIGFQIRRLNTNGSVDNTFTPIIVGSGGSLNEEVMRKQSDGKLLIGTDGQRVLFGTKYALGRFNSDGTLDSTFNSGGSGFLRFATVTDIEVLPNDKIMVVGNFNEYNGVKCNGIIRLNSDGSLDNTFTLDENIYSGTTNYLYPNDIEVDLVNNKLYVGCDTILGVSKYQNNNVGAILRLDIDGTYDNTFITTGITGINQVVEDLYKQNDKIYVGGIFTGYQGQSFNNFIRINLDGSLDTSFNTGTKLNGWVNDIEITPDGGIVAVGTFEQYGDQITRRFVKVDPQGNSLIV